MVSRRYGEACHRSDQPTLGFGARTAGWPASIVFAWRDPAFERLATYCPTALAERGRHPGGDRTAFQVFVESERIPVGGDS